MKKIGSCIGVLLSTFLFAICGYLVAKYGIGELENLTTGERLFKISLCFVAIYVAVIVQIIIHEAGHLIFGQLSGYEFSSFRIFSFMWIKKNGKIELKRLNIAGTGGQCLMSPPDMVDGKVPVILYNLGGCITNLCSGILFFFLANLCHINKNVFLIFLLLGIVGVGFAVTNGLPLMGTVNNDGYNAFSLGKNKEGMKAFWITMKINELISVQNKRLKDMPGELFFMPEKQYLKDSLIASIGVYYCNYLMDLHRFEEAKNQIEYLLENSTGVVELHKALLKNDLAYIALLNGEMEEAKNIITDKNVAKIRKAMKDFPSVIRTEYAYALLCEKDEKKAEKKLEMFHRIEKTYPNTSDIESEMELIEVIQDVER